MDNFKDYAYYYNLIYNDKNYKEEAEQIASLLRKYGCTRENATVLNLGCGKGRHDAELDKLGYHMTGIDMSEDMIQLLDSRINMTRLAPLLRVLHISQPV